MPTEPIYVRWQAGAGDPSPNRRGCLERMDGEPFGKEETRMGGSGLRGLVVLSLASAMMAVSLGGVATAASLPMVAIGESSLSIPSIGPTHNPFGPLHSGQTLAEVFTTTQPFNLVEAATPT